MAVLHHVQLLVSTTGLLGGGGSVNVDAILNNGDYDYQMITLASGDNTIVVPTNGQGIVIIPPVASTEAILLKGNVSDVGINIGKTKFTYLALDQDGTDIILTCSGEIADCEIILL